MFCAKIVIAMMISLIGTSTSMASIQPASHSEQSTVLRRKPLLSPVGIHSDQMISYTRTKRQVFEKIQEFQDYLQDTKTKCALALNFREDEVQKSLLYETNPTSKEKCLMECILRKAEIMDPSNKLSKNRVGWIADLISNNNALVVSIAIATAEKCNKYITAKEPCEAAYQINKCIANELKTHRIRINY